MSAGRIASAAAFRPLEAMNGVWPKMGFAEPSVHLAALCPARRIFGDP
jgi:hypothetical protein